MDIADSAPRDRRDSADNRLDFGAPPREDRGAARRAREVCLRNMGHQRSIPWGGLRSLAGSQDRLAASGPVQGAMHARASESRPPARSARASGARLARRRLRFACDRHRAQDPRVTATRSNPPGPARVTEDAAATIESPALAGDSALQRRGGDSNSRYANKTHNGFRDRRIQPLCHPSRATTQG